MKATSDVKFIVICKSFLRRKLLCGFMGFWIVYSIYSLGIITDDAAESGWPKSSTQTTTTSLPQGNSTGSLNDVSMDPVELIHRKETSPVPSVTSTGTTGMSTPQPTTKQPLPLLDNIPINPPTLDLELWNKILESKEDNLTLLSDLIQNQIRSVQLNCSGVTLKCGYFNNEGGFASQVHHRVSCLMISYALSIPLIHDEIEGWLYSKKWSDLFLPLGSNCSEGPQTFPWTWNTPNLYSWPLTYGIPVTELLADFINKNLEHPFHWLVGQFMKYALKPNAQVERDVKRDMAAIKFQRPIIGLHVRRTDKRQELGTSHHEIPEYMRWAEKGYKNLLNRTTLSKPHLRPTVFIASDDAATVILEAQKKYKNWTVLGFPSQPTLKDPESRKDAFYDIVRDIFILAECDYVVCGFASNVCTLVLEMLSFKHGDGYSLVKSMDIDYHYAIHGKKVRSLQVIGIRANETQQFLRRKSPTSWE